MNEYYLEYWHEKIPKSMNREYIIDQEYYKILIGNFEFLLTKENFPFSAHENSPFIKRIKYYAKILNVKLIFEYDNRCDDYDDFKDIIISCKVILTDEQMMYLRLLQ